MRHLPIPLLVLTVFLLLAGCDTQPATYLVHGMVVYPDGRPLTRGTVEFEALGLKKPITASGEIAPDGTFQLGTFAVNDGAIAGQHRVAVIADYEIGTEIERPEMLPPPVLNPKFSDFKTSGLEFTVKPASNNLLVEVEYALPPQTEPGTDAASLESPAE